MRWILFFERGERKIRLLAILGVVAILIAQFSGGCMTDGLSAATQPPKQANTPTSASQSGDISRTSSVDFELTDADLQSQRIVIMVNGTTQGEFSGMSLRLNLHQNDVVTIKTSGVQNSIHVTVDHNDPNLFYPAPGYTISVDDEHPYTFDKVEFMQPTQ